MRILLLSRYTPAAASSRYRMYQYVPYLEQHGCKVTIAPLLSDRYVKNLYAGKPIPMGEVLGSYISRVRLLVQQDSYDRVWLQQEGLPWVPDAIESRLFRARVPLLVDHDDAYFHRYDRHSLGIVRLLLGRKIDSVMRRASLVVAGSRYLADRARASGASRVERLPTVVDLDRYQVIERDKKGPFTIGWIGSPGTSKYLRAIRSTLQAVVSNGAARFVAIGAASGDLEGFPGEVRPWSSEKEVAELRQCDVGIMPLPDEPWERGKCGFKLIQYMACGLPVVASPVGANMDIVESGKDGFLANTPDEWIKALSILRDDRKLRMEMGANGRKKVEKRYCLAVTAPRILQLFRETAGR